MPTFESCAHSLRRYLFLPLCVWACNCRILFSRSSPGDDSIDGGDLTRKSGFKSLFIRKTYSGPNPDAYRGPNEDLLLWVKYFEAECCERNEIDDDFDFFFHRVDYIAWNGANPDLCIGSKSLAKGTDSSLRTVRSSNAHGPNTELYKGPKIGLAKGSIYSPMKVPNVKCNWLSAVNQ